MKLIRKNLYIALSVFVVIIILLSNHMAALVATATNNPAICDKRYPTMTASGYQLRCVQKAAVWDKNISYCNEIPKSYSMELEGMIPLMKKFTREYCYSHYINATNDTTICSSLEEPIDACGGAS